MSDLMIGIETRKQRDSILNTLRTIVPDRSHIGIEGHADAPFSVLTQASRGEVDRALPPYLRRGCIFWSVFS